MNQSTTTASPIRPSWHRIPADEWAVYRNVLRRASERGIRFAFGGAFATAEYTGELRNTKDFDIYIRPVDRAAMIQVMGEAGLTDHFDRLAYDHSWIYRASQGDIIVDAIWAMANHRAEVDEDWLSRGPEVSILGEPLRAIPIEELIWSKLYVLQHERCDWTDIFNLLDARLETIYWDRLLSRLSEDAPLLVGAVSVFSWLAPDRASAIPPGVRDRLGLHELPTGSSDVSRARANLLDSRPWFIRHTR
ncbi:MAG: nucleotidyltransferase family protein [Gemmatimonadales bacterium]